MKVLPLLAVAGLAATPLCADVLVSSFDGDKVLRYSDGGVFLNDLITAGSGGLDAPHRTRLGPDGALYVASAGTNQILRYNAATGAFLGAFVTAGSGGLDYPVDMIFHADGYLYVSSQGSNEILRFDSLTGQPDLTYSASATGFTGPSGIVIDDHGNLFAAGRYSHTIARFDRATGTFETAFATGSMPFGLALTSTGQLFSAAGGANEVLRFTDITAGTPVSTVLIESTPFPVGIEIGPDGTLFTASYTTNALLRYDAATGSNLGIFLESSSLEGPNFFTFVVPEPASLLLVAVPLLAFHRFLRKISKIPA